MAGKRWQRAFDDPIPLPIKSQDISPGGLSWPEFQKDMLAAQENSRTMGDEEMCVAAAAMVGPDGVVARDLMVPKEGQPLLAGGPPSGSKAAQLHPAQEYPFAPAPEF
jgi:hypothetical protein